MIQDIVIRRQVNGSRKRGKARAECGPLMNEAASDTTVVWCQGGSGWIMAHRYAHCTIRRTEG